MRKLTTLLTIVGVATLLFSGLWVYAAYSVWSNEVTINVNEYTLTLTVDNDSGFLNQNFIFTGTLNYNGGAVEGKTVELYLNGTATGLTDTTDAMGGYNIEYNATVLGTTTCKTLVVVS